jgi:hypothetical protein
MTKPLTQAIGGDMKLVLLACSQLVVAAPRPALIGNTRDGG